MNRKFLLIVPIVVIAAASWWFYQQSLINPAYLGLPTVPCQDSTTKFQQNFTVTISIVINGSVNPLSPNIGHDAANCLREIYTDDDSGLVYVKANDTHQFLLGDFFNDWRRTFSSEQVFNYVASNGHVPTVYVNGTIVGTYQDTPLVPNEQIEVVYH